MEDKAIKDAMSSIKNIIRRVYDQGQEDGLNAGLYDSVIIDRDVYGQGYEKGLKDAWKCAWKIYIELSMDKCIEIFGGKSWFDYTASEAIAKIEEYEEKQKQSEDAEIKVGDDSSLDNKEDDTYVYLYKGTFSQVKKGNSVILSTDITYWDHNIHDDKVLKAGEIHTIKEYFPETGACLITVNNEKNYNEILNKDRCKKCPNDHKCRLCLTGINYDQLDKRKQLKERSE